MNNVRSQLHEQVKTALSEATPLKICGGDSKAFYGNPINAQQVLDIKPYAGIVSYEPTELCITVRAGTRLKDLEEELSKHQQMLPFEPPLFTDSATIGGAVAAGLSGPRRPYTGAVRDAILGTAVINGFGEIVNFGGQVMKNVAGYDVSRLMTGSQGTLGPILEVSLRLIPKPEKDITYQLPMTQQEALDYFTTLRQSRLPVTASCYIDNQVHIRLSGSEKQLINLIKNHDLQPLDNGDIFWQSIRNQSHPFFEKNNKPLWRLSTPPAAPAHQQPENHLMLEWGGAIRWITSNSPPNIIQDMAKKAEGGAILFRGDVAGACTFPKPEPALFKLQQHLKRQLDPKGIFNPNRLYEGL